MTNFTCKIFKDLPSPAEAGIDQMFIAIRTKLTDFDGLVELLWLRETDPDVEIRHGDDWQKYDYDVGDYIEKSDDDLTIIKQDGCVLQWWHVFPDDWPMEEQRMAITVHQFNEFFGNHKYNYLVR